MGRLAVVASALLVGTAGCGACEPDKAPPPSPSTSASSAASSGSTRPPPITSHPAHTPPPPKLACRIIALDGEAHVETASGDAGTTPLLLQGLAPVDAWFSFGKGSRVIARDPRTTRETTFRGPGRARACVGFTEESWLTSGTFESAVGAGEAPGNEEWVVTPSGIVRYTSAGLSLEVKPHEADVEMTSGVAFAWQPSAGGANAAAPPGDAGALEEGWLRLPMGKTRLGLGHDETASAALDRCVALSASAKDLAGQVMAPGGASGSLITRQVTTRRLARAACTVASLRVNALPPADAAPLLRPLADANMAWSGQPTATP